MFSPGYGRSHSGKYNKTGVLPSGVVRIKSGAEEFDASYYYNIETLSGGNAMYRCWHITGNYFLLQMYEGTTDEQKAIGGIGGTTTHLAIFNGADGSFKYVEGLDANVTSFGSTPYFEGGKAYVPTVMSEGQPVVYVVDPASATAVKGLTVVAESISAIGRLRTL